MSRTPFIAGNWKMHKTIAEAEAFIRRAAPAGRRGRRRRDRDLPAVPRAAGDGRLRARLERRSLRAEHARGRLRRLHRRGVGADAHRDRRRRRDPRPLRAPPVLQRDRPRAAAEGAARAGGRAHPDPLRRRDRGGARARRHRAQAAPPGPGGAGEGPQGPAARGRRRLRADLGDRHRPRRHARAGAGGRRVRARAGRGPRQGRRPGGARPLRRLAQARQRAPSCWRCPTSTAR